MEPTGQPERTYFLKSGESLTIDGLANKLKGAYFELTQEAPALDEDTALAALASFNDEENIIGAMSADEVTEFIDDFCEAWAKDST